MVEHFLIIFQDYGHLKFLATVNLADGLRPIREDWPGTPSFIERLQDTLLPLGLTVATIAMACALLFFIFRKRRPRPEDPKVLLRLEFSQLVQSQDSEGTSDWAHSAYEFLIRYLEWELQQPASKEIDGETKTERESTSAILARLEKLRFQGKGFPATERKEIFRRIENRVKNELGLG